jgi:hypothetical protein
MWITHMQRCRLYTAAWPVPCCVSQHTCYPCSTRHSSTPWPGNCCMQSTLPICNQPQQHPNNPTPSSHSHPNSPRSPPLLALLQWLSCPASSAKRAASSAAAGSPDTRCSRNAWQQQHTCGQQYSGCSAVSSTDRLTAMGAMPALDTQRMTAQRPLAA